MTPLPHDRSADRLFAHWLEEQAAGTASDLEALCAEHPEHASGLRALHSHWIALEAVRRERGPGRPLAEKLESHFGSGVDPHVTLEGEESGKGEFSSEVLSRLAGRGPVSTRYRLKGELAQGGMGAVLRVWDEDLRRHLAMKVMLGKGESHEKGDTPLVDARLLARFLEEAQVTGQLDHPGIVPVHELGLDAQGRVYFTMKLVKGVTLKEVFDDLSRGEGGWTQTRALGLLLKVCEAMSYAHVKGVIHRDLKPANVMVGRYGEVYVMDWGLAKILSRAEERDIRPSDPAGPSSIQVRSDRRERGGDSADSPLFTMDGDVLGTPAYMPPEQARGDLAAMGPHSDVYAVGAMLYHLLAGHMPYVPQGMKATNHAVWRSVIDGPPKPLAGAAPDAPSELVAISERAMAREPSQRYADTSALAEDLSAFIEGRVVRAYESGTWAEARKWVTRNKPLAAALAATFLAVIGGGIAFAVKAKEATAAAARAHGEAGRAAESERLARAQTAKVLRLSDVKRLQDLEAEAAELWPVHPATIPALESWAQRAQALIAGKSGHMATLEEMRRRARHPAAEERPEEVQPLEQTEAAKSGSDSDTQGSAKERDDTASREVDQTEVPMLPPGAALEGEVEGAPDLWQFDSTEDQWQHDVLAELVDDLEALEVGLMGEDVTAKAFGWSVPKRLARARGLEASFADGGEFAQAWAEALPSVRSAARDLELAPQTCLAPLERDPVSGLWEFWHILTGERPQRRADGSGWAIEPETGMVFVLIPAGSFAMGAQASDPQAPNYDPAASRFEGPVHERQVAAFFLSKYELTQAQWERLTGHNPSQYSPKAAVGKSDVATLPTNPVENVDWTSATATLERIGLVLPTEAQWEYAARGGTATAWWTGADRESLVGAANLADQAAARAGATWQDIADWAELDDGYPVHAPVDSFEPNPFGLYHVAGNVQELCADDWISNWGRVSGQTGAKVTVDPDFVAHRGGNYGNKASNARSAYRASEAKESGNSTTGLRPARRVE